MMKNLPAMQETHVRSLGWEIPWRKDWLPHGQRSLVGYSPWDHKESDRTELLTQQQRKEVRKIPDIET